MGAPIASKPHKKAGALYSCSLNPQPSNCQQFILDSKSGDDNIGILHHRRYGQWLGGSLDVSGSSLMVCAPRWSDQLHTQFYLQKGLCYWLPAKTEHVNTIATSLIPLLPKKKNAIQAEGSSFYLYGYGEAGLSVHITQKIDDQREILLGAPGVFAWKGTVIRYKENNTNNSTIPEFSYKDKPKPYSYFGTIFISFLKSI